MNTKIGQNILSTQLFTKTFSCFWCFLWYEIDYVNYGSSTQNRLKLERGFEPDSSFYIGENAELMRYRDRFLETDPPPDLVFEVDVTHSSLDKFPLMADIWGERNLEI